MTKQKRRAAREDDGKPRFRVDYGTITTGHLFNPDWDKPLVVISSNRSTAYYSVEVMQEIMIELGKVTRKAIEASARRSSSSPAIPCRTGTLPPNRRCRKT